LIHTTSTTLRMVIIGAFVLAAVFVGAGIWLVHLGAVGETKFTFFGQTFGSTNVGIAALFLGAVTVVLLLRRSLSTLVDVVRTESISDTKPRQRVEAWPSVRNEASLRRAVSALSDTQWAILEAVGTFDGILTYSLAEKIKGRPLDSELYFRLRGLIEEELVVEDDNKVYLSEAVRRLLKGRALRALRD
jgi:hypothetical protein